MKTDDDFEKGMEEFNKQGGFGDNYQPKPPYDFGELIASAETEKLPTGFMQIDRALQGGLERGGNFVLAGEAKSGKSSLALNWVNSMLRDKVKVGVLSTDMNARITAQILVASHFEKAKSELTQKDNKQWLANNSEYFQFRPMEALTSGGGVSHELLQKSCEELAEWGVKMIILDHATKFRENPPTGISDYASLTKAIAILSGVAEKYNLVCLTVLHTKSNSWTDSPERLRQLLQSGEAERYLEESLSVIAKPTSQTIYGGAGSRTNCFGTFILWRPFQNFENPDLNCMCRLLFENFRSVPPVESVRLHYDGARALFSEVLNPGKTNIENAKEIFGIKE